MAEETKVTGLKTTGSIKEALNSTRQGLTPVIFDVTQTATRPLDQQMSMAELASRGVPKPSTTAPIVAVQKDSVLGNKPTKKPVVASGITTQESAGTGITSTSTSQREITCPNCEGSVIISIAARVYSSIAGWLQSIGLRIEIPTAFVQYLRERVPTTKDAVFKSNCPVCNGTKKIKDPSDDTQKYVQAGQIAQTEAKTIEENEAKLGMGGNRTIFVQNNEYKKVGLVMNNAPSYRVDRDASYRLWGASTTDADPGTTFGVPRGATKAHVQGLSPISSPGGHYIIECTNKFSVVTGALGVEIKTGGPITISGGITKIIGPEITVGTSAGTLSLEGEVVNVQGKSIEMAPTDGHVVVRGSQSVTSNITVGGNAHLEKCSFIKAQTVGKNEMSKVGAPSNIYGGPAFWGGPALEGLQAAIKEYTVFTLANTKNPEQAKLIASPRYAANVADNIQNIAYMGKPQELVQTGICEVAGVPGIVYNFPHIHAIPDQIHCHETRIPNINCDADTAAEVRSAVAGNEGPAPLAVFSYNVIDAAKSLWGTISTVIIAPLATLVTGRNLKL